MRPLRRARAWPDGAVFLALLLACGGRVGSSAPKDGGPPLTAFSGYVTASQVAEDGSEELLASFSSSSTPQVLPFLGSCAADNEIVAGCCYAPTTPPRGASSVSAGNIQVDPGGGMPVLSLVGSAQYGYALQSPTLWVPGDVLRVTAAGQTVQSFSGSLQTVAPLEGVVPAMGTGPAPATEIDRMQDFSVQWTPGSVAGAEVGLWFDTSGSWIIACTAADAAGKLQVPSDLLQNVLAGDSAIVNLDRFSTTVVTTNNATVTLEGVAGISTGATFF
jgi:hypothetical protein